MVVMTMSSCLWHAECFNVSLLWFEVATYYSQGHPRSCCVAWRHFAAPRRRLAGFSNTRVL